LWPDRFSFLTMTRRNIGMMYKTEAEVALMKEAACLVSKALTEVASFIKPGVTTLQIDKLCETVVKDHGAVPSFFNYRGYPFIFVPLLMTWWCMVFQMKRPLKMAILFL